MTGRASRFSRLVGRHRLLVFVLAWVPLVVLMQLLSMVTR